MIVGLYYASLGVRPGGRVLLLDAGFVVDAATNEICQSVDVIGFQIKSTS